MDYYDFGFDSELLDISNNVAKNPPTQAPAPCVTTPYSGLLETTQDTGIVDDFQCSTNQIKPTEQNLLRCEMSFQSPSIHTEKNRPAGESDMPFSIGNE